MMPLNKAMLFGLTLVFSLEAMWFIRTKNAAAWIIFAILAGVYLTLALTA